MQATRFRVQQIDHVELFVPDRYEAAKWYERVLGCEIVRQFESWVTDDGPLMISPDGGSTKLALFTGQSQGSRGTAGFHRVAFRVNGQEFMNFLGRLGDLHLTDDKGERLTRDRVVDHELAFSVYFSDPFGHRLEITTYDHAYVAGQLSQA